MAKPKYSHMKKQYTKGANLVLQWQCSLETVAEITCFLTDLVLWFLILATKQNQWYACISQGMMPKGSSLEHLNATEFCFISLGFRLLSLQ